MLRYLAFLLPVILALVLLIAAAAGYVMKSGALQLLPPGSLNMAAGRPGSGYHALAERYRAILARDGIDLQIIETPGSMENSRMLATGEADVALIQGGTPVADSIGLQALAAVFLEPFFIFHRPEVTDAADLNAWNDLRLAAGEPGGGTRIAINNMIQTLGVDLDQDRMLPLAGAEAADALLSGEADLAIFVAPIDAPYLQPLLTDADLRIETLRDTVALTRKLPYVRMADIPPAGIDYSRRLPPERIPLTAMTAMLAANGDLHPALVNRLVHAAIEIHSGPTPLSDDLRFPSTQGLDLPLNRQAAALLTGGPGVLESLMPYWIAAQITRVTLLFLPLLVLMVPLLRMLPGLYAWSMRARIYRRYKELVAIDAEADSDVTAERLDALMQRLEHIDQEARAVQVPSRYREYVYTLRVHIDLVRRKLQEAAV
ncbi:TAXI family TRAP transporter solute-binding subunit [Pukyongiella litopenaei]|uniref:C4-dicarboxylate ABC transporter substrate-binding protein n=1 Tax=Pukyongiella litopenaei TaxID=2605946 RepID=A0A2S0MTL1_9RHOB|nr:TAXI family TRAP transporter solute-binding subunit [Pukyongiella litopenaei]AVO39230.2 hypothetical protein C6Y53_16950 [Pukyongiella litopenaei]